jgi:hypothetical protein
MSPVHIEGIRSVDQRPQIQEDSLQVMSREDNTLVR